VFAIACQVMAGAEARDSRDVDDRAANAPPAAVDRGFRSPLRIAATTPASSSISYRIESVQADFGAVSPGAPKEILGAAVIRVFSTEPWALKFAPEGPSSLTTSGTEFLPMSRLAWRANGGSYQPFRTAQPVTLSAGGPTSALGSEVRVDLRLEVEDNDPLSPLALVLNILAETR
jgi:hypothetical protein